MASSTTLPRGCRILLTRTREDVERWATQIEAAGAEAVALPCIVCEPIRSPELGAQLASAIEHADWLVLTSARGVAHVAEHLEPRGSLPRHVHVAVVGPVTEGVAREYWGRVDLIAPEGTAVSLADALIPLLPAGPTVLPTNVVVAGPEQASPDLERRLEDAGTSTKRFSIYRTIPAPPEEPREDLAKWNLHAIFLASPSAVQGLLNKASVPAGIPLISIGPSTTEAAVEAGLTVSSEATTRSLEGLLNALPDAVIYGSRQ